MYHPDPDTVDVNPFPTPEPVPYDPEDPHLPEPTDAPPPPQRAYVTPEEAIANVTEPLES